MRSQMARVMALAAPALVVSACAAASDDDLGVLEARQDVTLCGNGHRDPGEQCDDGAQNGHDACSASCQFEQVHRIDTIKMLFAPDAFCTSNALGSAVKSSAQGQMQDAVSNAVGDGRVSVFLRSDGLDDLTGQSDPSLSLASFVGDPVVGAALGLDSWYTVRRSSLDPNGAPQASLAGAITGGKLAAGPGNLAFALSLGASLATLRLSATKLRATVGASSVPAASSGASPGVPSSVNLDPALTSFGAMTNGQLCGNVSAGSLAAIPVPPELAGGSVSCAQGYTTSNSMLDVIVGGCRVLFLTALAATQPDKSDPEATALGAGAPYTFQVGAARKVTGCKDKSGASVALDGCLKAAAYSAGFQFTTKRVVLRGTTDT
jgi:cysteine-rich repeat protein